MRRTARLGVSGLTIVAALLSAAYASPRGAPAARGARASQDGKQRLRREIDSLNAAMMAAFRRGDLRAVARFYADDARIVGPRRSVTAGREAIDRYWTGVAGAKSWKLEVVDVGGSRDDAYQVGVSSLTTVRDGAEATYTTDFVVIWKRQPNGEMKIALDLYN